ncbi:hypothetical protein ERO13_A09G105700v2 [Gossypium hirsutum]|uniref:Uncharacterized protein n=3 Tax=Gossypium TaxID=3633 RepID=A0A5J5UD23_GOSBA|nr:hypothetical protein ES319_A09G112200v1 [Gossypium barbadense]KAG4183360.1 hypothetical protein ERO13_A09G105700v2 [Gossypium hirsutum]TYH02334.1 hypothetical protein ES288_A09G132400v1 [Gossypium darwinii]TYI10214.1 hypothetical protein ES332_A09G127600v1 [Gossypium tomentosum]
MIHQRFKARVYGGSMKENLAISVQGSNHRADGTLTEARGVRGDRGCGAGVDRNPRVSENFKYFGAIGPCNVGLVSGLDL